MIPRRAMLLCAGSGTRLRPLTDGVPKVMVPIGGVPLLQHTVEHLARFGVRELVINLSYRPQAVQAHFGDGRSWGVSIHYSVEEEALGTAGGIRRVADRFRDGPFLVWYGDNLSHCDLGRLSAAHSAGGGLATLALHYREDPTHSGMVGAAPDGRIERFLEKPRPEQVISHWVSAGIMVLEPAVLDAIPPTGAPDLGRDVLPALLARGERLYSYRLSEAEGLWWVDTPGDLARVQAQWEERRTP